MAVKSSDLPFSTSVRAGDTIYLSGTVPVDDHGNIVGETIEEQTRFVMSSIDRELKRHGASFENLVKMVVLLTNIDDWAKMNVVYREYVERLRPMPARAAYEARLATPALLVEIEAIAYVGKVTGPQTD